jgi:Nup133 N terminal like
MQAFDSIRTLPSIFYTYRAWITIDNKLYLWNYLFPQECETYEGVSEIILSVSLAAPKPGMFVDTIKYVLVLGESASQPASQSVSQSLIEIILCTSLPCSLNLNQRMHIHIKEVYNCNKLIINYTVYAILRSFQYCPYHV